MIEYFRLIWTDDYLGNSDYRVETSDGFIGADMSADKLASDGDRRLKFSQWRSQPHFRLGYRFSRCALHAAAFMLRSSRCILHTALLTLRFSHCAIRAAIFSPRSSRCVLHAKFFTLRSSRCTLHVALFTKRSSY